MEENTNTPIVGPDTSKLTADSAVIVPAFGLGRFAPFNWERLPHSTAIRLFWKRVIVWLFILACIGWVTLASGLFAFVKYKRGFTDVQYSHMLFLPWKLDEYRRAKAEFFIKQGLDFAEKQEWRKAYELLRLGLITVPDNLDGRLMLARIYLMLGRTDVTKTLLIDGLKYHANQSSYLLSVLWFFFNLQSDNTVIGLTTELRGRLAPGSGPARIASNALATAYINRARYGEAEEILRADRLLGTPEGRMATARISWARGKQEQALRLLRELTEEVPQEYEFYRVLITYLTEDKRWSEMRRASVARQLALPGKAEGYVHFMEACGKEGDEARRTEAEEEFLRRFADDGQALLHLAELASREGRAGLAAKVALRCRVLGRAEAESALLWLGAQMEARDYPAMIELWKELSPRSTTWSERDQMILEGMRAVALYGVHKGVEAAPLAFHLIETKLLPVPVLTGFAIQLQRVGQETEARRVLRHAVQLDTLNQQALGLLLRGLLADNQLQDAVPLVRRLPAMRDPPEDLLRGYLKAMDSDLAMFIPDRAEVRVLLREVMRQRHLEP